MYHKEDESELDEEDSISINYCPSHHQNAEKDYQFKLFKVKKSFCTSAAKLQKNEAQINLATVTFAIPDLNLSPEKSEEISLNSPVQLQE